MNRIIMKTQSLVVGAGSVAATAAQASMNAGAETIMLHGGKLTDVPQGAEVVEGVKLDKIILYPEGRVAGVMGHQTGDGRKVIVNCDAVILTGEAVKEYKPLCLAFGAVEADGGLKTRENGLMVNGEGKDIGGMFVVTDPQLSGGDGGKYAVFVDETIYARFRKMPMVHKEPTIPGEYYLTILGIDGVPKHHIVIEEKDGVLTGMHATENDNQPMQDLRIENGYLCWNLWSGTTSSELFTFQVKCYSNTWLGGTWRIDTENAHRTPVMMEPTVKSGPFGAPPEK